MRGGPLRVAGQAPCQGARRASLCGIQRVRARRRNRERHRRARRRRCCGMCLP